MALANILNNILTDTGVDVTSLQPLLTNPVTGTGTTNYVPKWTGSTALGNSLLTDVSNALTYEASSGNAAFNLKSPSGYYYPAISLFSNGAFSGSLYSYLSRMYLTANGGGLWFGNATTTQMVLTNSGRVLIGTTTESTYELDVVGDIRSTLDANINGLTVGKGGGNNANNTAFGVSALGSNTTGTQNVAIGVNALGNNTTANFNVAIGFQAGQLITQNSNTAVGYYAGYANNTGYENTAIGSLSQRFCASGYQNTTVGVNSGYGITSGNRNTFFGTNSGYDITTGTFNTMVGSGAAGNGITTGSFNTIIGSQVSGLSSSLSNTIILADGQGNQRLYINSSGNVGIGSTNPASKLTLNQAATGEQKISFTLTGTEYGYFLVNTSAGSVQLGSATYAAQYYGTSHSFNNTINLNTTTFTGQNPKINIAGYGSIYVNWDSPSLNIESSSNTLYSIRFNTAGGTERMRIFGATGNLAIGTTTDGGEKLQVNGTARVSGNFTVSGPSGSVTNLDIFGGTTGGSGQTLRIYGSTPTTQGLFLTYTTATAESFIDAGYHTTSSGASFGDIIFRSKKNATNTLAENMRIRGFDGNVLIGTSTNDASAIVNISSTTKGFLPPRQTQAQRTAITSPAVGLIVYQTDATEGLYIYTSTGWVQL